MFGGTEKGGRAGKKKMLQQCGRKLKGDYQILLYVQIIVEQCHPIKRIHTSYISLKSLVYSNNCIHKNCIHGLCISKNIKSANV